MAGIIFPTDLQQVKPQDETLLLGADANDIARNIKASELVDYVKSNVPLDELAETISEQQATISEQQAAASEQVQTMARLVATQSAPALEAELAAGKTDLASAITAKGVETAPTDSLATMADKVLQVPQQVNTRTSDFEQIIAPYPYIWNVYTVATDLMKNELPDYIPDYMQSYKSRYGANAFFVGEYYLGYATLELTGADAYLTCDGDFYTLINGVVTHTLPDGSVEQYEAESIVHTWHDAAMTMSNRWVAFFYLTDGYAFANANSSICPRRVALCGNCMSLMISGENRLTDVWVIGSLKHIEGGTTGNTWNPAQVMRVSQHNVGNIYTTASNVTSIILPELKEISGGNVVNNSANSLVSLSLPALTEISGGSLLYTSNGNSFTSLVSLSLPALTEMSGGSLIQNGGSSSSFNALVSLSLPVLKEISGGCLISGDRNKFNLVSLRLPVLKEISGGCLINGGYYNNLEIVCPELEAITGTYRPIIQGGISADMMPNSHAYFPKLRSFFTTIIEGASGMMNQVWYIYFYVLEVGTYYVAGPGSYSVSRNKYILLGCKGTRTQLIKVYGWNTYTFEVEIGDKEYIDAGLQPRWQPRQPLNFANVVMTAENLALRILDRLADNTYEDDGVTPAESITITLGASNISRLEADETYAPYIAAAQAKNYTIV